MPPLISLTGKTYGRWKVIKQVGYRGKKAFWLCRCVCGIEREIVGANLRDGHSRSCGCLNSEIAKARVTTHGMTGTRLHIIWVSMWRRCVNHRAHNYKHYGARGITVCSAWRDLKKFAEWAYANGYDSCLTLDRKNNDGNYTPKNCRWVSQRFQTRNYRRNIFVTYRGAKMCLIDAAKAAGLRPGTVHGRRNLGWPRDRWLDPVRNKAEEMVR